MGDLGSAVLGGGLISGVSSLFGANTQAQAAEQAAQLQAQSAANALALQKQMFTTAQNAVSPFMNAGSSVLPTLTALETPGTSASMLSQMPGFQFQSQYGSMAAQNALSAQGLGGSRGPLAAAISSYNNGLAGTYYQNTVNALQNTANMGSNAAGTLAGAAINSGNSQGQTAQSYGTALASGTLGAGNAIAGGIGGVGSSASNALLMSSILGANKSNGLYGNLDQTMNTINAQSNTLNNLYSGGFTS